MAFSMASSSNSAPPSSSRSWRYDVFLSFRGVDVRKTFVDHLYSALIGMRGLIVMPIFYDVDPLQVRKQQGNSGKAFAKQEVKNISKVLHETKVIKEIVDDIQDRLFPLESDVDEELVGMRERLQDLISQLEIRTSDVQMAGIWGKTTLASSVYKQISRHFHGHCVVANIREASSKHGLETLQQKIPSTLLKIEVEVQSVEEGKHIMKSRLCNRFRFLMLLGCMGVL
uniref:disease resistance protein RUN1-like n=1 Tax=Erigeron canadensis TaxID=72917 RepID=UPI001CB924E5|nr:disease resistance protein RUN1-like [Erigeron canadensis]